MVGWKLWEEFAKMRQICPIFPFRWPLWPWLFSDDQTHSARTLLLSILIYPESFAKIKQWQGGQIGVTDGRTDGRTDGQTDRWTDGRTGAFIYLPKWQIIKNNDTFLEKLFHENHQHRPPPLFLMQYFSIFEENTINYHVFSCRSVKNQYFWNPIEDMGSLQLHYDYLDKITMKTRWKICENA